MTAAPSRRPPARHAPRVRLLAALVPALLLHPALAAGAGEQGGRAPARRQAPLTSYAAGPLRAASLVVVGRTRALRVGRHQQIARVEVLDVLLGDPPARPLTVLVRGPRPTADLRDPDATTFPPVGAPPHVLFLGTKAGGLTVEYRDGFPVDGEQGRAKVEALRHEIRLARIGDPERRARETLGYLVASVASRRPWTRAHALRELTRFARVRRDLIGEALANRFRARARGTVRPEQRRLLETLVRTLDEVPRMRRPARDGARGEAAVETDPWRAGLRRQTPEQRSATLAALLRAPGAASLARVRWAYGVVGAELRRRIVRGLTALERPALLPGIRAWYAGEEDAGVRAAIVRAVGVLGGGADVDWLVARAQNPALARVAWLALARIRTAGAKRALQAERDRVLAAEDPGAAAAARWIDWLLSPAFERSTLVR